MARGQGRACAARLLMRVAVNLSLFGHRNLQVTLGPQQQDTIVASGSAFSVDYSIGAFELRKRRPSGARVSVTNENLVIESRPLRHNSLGVLR